MSDKIELNRRRVLGGIATVGAASAALGAGTFAYFSDTEQSSDNTISTGDLDLEEFNRTDGSLDGLLPGETTDTISITADYTGIDSPAFDWGLAISNDYDPDDGTNGDSFSETIDLEDATLSVERDGDDSYTQVNNYSTDSDISSLADLDTVFSDAISGNDAENLADGDTVKLDLQFGLVSGVTGDYAGVSVDFGVAFHARQDSADPLAHDDILVE